MVGQIVEQVQDIEIRDAASEVEHGLGNTDFPFRGRHCQRRSIGSRLRGDRPKHVPGEAEMW
ncbi:hypothetical protein GCM10018954_036360 [Kutzneria kofuensis]